MRPAIRQSSIRDRSLSSLTSTTPAIASARMMINPMSAADLRWSAPSSLCPVRLSIGSLLCLPQTIALAVISNNRISGGEARLRGHLLYGIDQTPFQEDH